MDTNHLVKMQEDGPFYVKNDKGEYSLCFECVNCGFYSMVRRECILRKCPFIFNVDAEASKELICDEQEK
jgi:hypothetical protein